MGKASSTGSAEVSASSSEGADVTLEVGIEDATNLKWAGPTADTPSATTASTHVLDNGAAPEATPAPAAAGSKRRLFFIDYLRLFLTVLVVVHHCIHTAADPFWFGQVPAAGYQDIAIAWLDRFFYSGNQAYFMTLFFLLSGYFTPPSYKRKGAAKHLLDRSIRLLIPMLVYSFVIQPLVLWIAQPAAQQSQYPSGLDNTGNVFHWYFTSGSKVFTIANGQAWFIWMLWWFDVAYVCCCMLSDSSLACRARKACASIVGWFRRAAAACWVRNGRGNDQDLTEVSSGLSRMSSASSFLLHRISFLTRTLSVSNFYTCPGNEYSLVQTLVSAGVLVTAFSTVSFVMRLLTYSLGAYGFWRPCFFVSFMPAYIGQYAMAFVMGTVAYRENALRRLPSRCGGWCLAAAALWWVEGYFVPYAAGGYTWFAAWSTQSWPMNGPMVAFMFYHTFLEQSFGVVWSLGLLVVFRDLWNHPPNTFGIKCIGAAYGVYIIHPVFVALFGRAFMVLVFHSHLVNALAISPLVVIASWMVAAAVKEIPGAGHVL